MIFAFNITDNAGTPGFPRKMNDATIGNLYITRATTDYFFNQSVIWAPNGTHLNTATYPHRFQFEILHSMTNFNAKRNAHAIFLDSLQSAVARSSDGYIQQWHMTTNLIGYLGLTSALIPPKLQQAIDNNPPDAPPPVEENTPVDEPDEPIVRGEYSV